MQHAMGVYFTSEGVNSRSVDVRIDYLFDRRILVRIAKLGRSIVRIRMSILYSVTGEDSQETDTRNMAGTN